jgi:hypothetical protein
MLHHNNIRTVFVRAMSYGRELHDDNYFGFEEYMYTRETMVELGHPETPTKFGHMNNIGHKYVADKLTQMITDMKRDTE